MKNHRKATSIVEAMVIMLIIVTGVTGMYRIYIESTRLSDSTQQRLQAIQIAREGIEALENIRNTNWTLYKLDVQNCWNTLNYDNNCVGNNGTSTDIVAGSYIVFPDSGSRWTLSGVTDTSSNFNQYIDLYEVGKQNQFYTQTGSFTSLIPNMTREIIISYPGGDSNNAEMDVKSLVQWSNRGQDPSRVELDLTLTNWRDKN